MGIVFTFYPLILLVPWQEPFRIWNLDQVPVILLPGRSILQEIELQEWPLRKLSGQSKGFHLLRWLFLCKVTIRRR